jgi:hypothetical protein
MEGKFDIEGARAAGASDDSILQYLTQTRNYDVEGALQAGASKGQVIAYLSGSAPRGASTIKMARTVDELPELIPEQSTETPTESPSVSGFF